MWSGDWVFSFALNSPVPLPKHIVCIMCPRARHVKGIISIAHSANARVGSNRPPRTVRCLSTISPSSWKSELVLSVVVEAPVASDCQSEPCPSVLIAVAALFFSFHTHVVEERRNVWSLDYCISHRVRDEPTPLQGAREHLPKLCSPPESRKDVVVLAETASHSIHHVLLPARLPT
jgi:hypothetical protein